MMTVSLSHFGLLVFRLPTMKMLYIRISSKPSLARPVLILNLRQIRITEELIRILALTRILELEPEPGLLLLTWVSSLWI